MTTQLEQQAIDAGGVDEALVAAQVTLRLAAIERRYKEGEGTLDVLTGADLDIHAGEIVALVAPSGAGKSTLLHMAGLLEKPDGGEVFIGGRAAGRLGDAERTTMRRLEIGFVYQFHHLLPEFTARENVAMPLLIGGMAAREAGAQADAMLARVGLAPRAGHKPGELSGGERQRVAIARALAGRPAVVLADEPTGNLDRRTAEDIQALMLELNSQLAISFLLVTHDLALAARCHRVLELRDGQFVQRAPD